MRKKVESEHSPAEEELPRVPALAFLLLPFLTSLLGLLSYRLLEVSASYHFAFLAAAICLAGLAVGAVVNHLFQRFLEKNFRTSVAWSSLLTGIGTIVFAFILSREPVSLLVSGEEFERLDFWQTCQVLFSLLVAFAFAGVGLSLLLCRFAERADAVYSRFLIGVALSSLMIIPVQRMLPYDSSLIFCAVLFSALAMFLAETLGLKIVSGAVFLLVCGLFTVHSQQPVWGPLWVNGERDSDSSEKRWDAFSFVRLLRQGKATPSGPGYGAKKRSEVTSLLADEALFEVDGLLRIPVSRLDGQEFDREKEKLRFLSYELSAAPMSLVRPGRVLLFGPGSLADVLRAAYFGYQEIWSLTNDDALYSLQSALRDRFSSGLASFSQVNFLRSGARSFLASSEEKFDLIQFSLVDDYAASKSFGQALKIEPELTVEAVRLYFSHLTDEGVFSIPALFEKGKPPRIFRSVDLLRQAVYSLGMGQEDLMARVAILGRTPRTDLPGRVQILLKKTPFRNEEIESLYRFSVEHGFELFLEPKGGGDHDLRGGFDEAKFDETRSYSDLDLSAPSDLRPFFYSLEKVSWKQFPLVISRRMNAVQILFVILCVSGLIYLGAYFIPLLTSAAATTYSLTNTLLYNYSGYSGFGAIFFLLSTITRFHVYLEHPRYTFLLTVPVLFLSAALGSFLLAKRIEYSQVIRVHGATLLYGVFFCVVGYPLLAMTSEAELSVRILLSIVLLFPLGSFLGALFPIVLKRAACSGGELRISWAWHLAMIVEALAVAQILLFAFGAQITSLFGLFNLLGAFSRYRRREKGMQGESGKEHVSVKTRNFSRKLLHEAVSHSDRNG